jgi:hypothetical protein
MMRLSFVEDYLAGVPGGIDGYPQCFHRGDPLARWIEHSPTAGLRERLPAPAAALLRPGARIPNWVPEVHATIIFLAIRELHFRDDAAFLEHSRRCNRAVLETPANRLILWAASPRAILRGVSLRWGSLHRGSTLAARTPGEGSAELTLTFPPRLLPEIVLRGNATGIREALEGSGGRDVEVDLHAMEPTRAVFRARWQ